MRLVPLVHRALPMPDLTGGPGRSRDRCLTVALQSLGSSLRASDGRDIPFAREMVEKAFPNRGAAAPARPVIAAQRT